MNPTVDAFLSKAKQWQEEMSHLRKILLDIPELTEDFKWGKPCYTLGGKNIALIHGFKEYCAILFHKGALLSDPHNLLIQQTENSQAARQLRFCTLREIIDQREHIIAYVEEAIELELSGKEVAFKSTGEYEVPVELQEKLDEDPDYKAAFEALTPGRKRGYLLHFAEPKQSKTRTARVEKLRDKIFEGKGYNER